MLSELFQLLKLAGNLISALENVEGRIRINTPIDVWPSQNTKAIISQSVSSTSTLVLTTAHL